jgi:PPP family 3-phenylpropionic acid transporter
VSLPVRFALFYVAIFLFVGVYVPFWPVWLASRGLNAEEIGIVLALAHWLRAVGPPVVSNFADRRGERWRVIAVLSGVVAAAYPLYALAGGLWGILAVTALVILLQTPVYPLVDNLVMLTAHERRFDYGRVRLWGSLSFVGAATATGAVIVDRPASLLLWLIVAALVITFLMVFLLPRTRPPAARSTRGPVRTLLANRTIITFLACVGFAQASHAAYYGFATLHWRSAGYSEEIIGALWAEGVVVEVALFAFSGAVVARLGPQRLLAIAILAGIVRWTMTGATTNLGALVFVQALHGLTFGAAHLAAMHFLLRAVPVELSGTAQSLYSGPGMAVTTGLATLLAGWLYKADGGSAFYAMAATSFLAGIAWLALVRQWDGGGLHGLVSAAVDTAPHDSRE